VRRACDGPGLLAAFRAAVGDLEAHVDEINGLNVYPVPDGDTGTNMVATVRAALHEAEALTDPTLERVAAAISFGALMGARGNSGVITSQIFRGMAEGLGGKKRFNGLDLAHALTVGSQTAYKAVVKPVEGTILTVIREASEAAVTAAERANDVESVLTSAVIAAETALARTPSLLPILREAGVVDAGGAGLARLFQGALGHLVGTTPASPSAGHAARASALVSHSDEGYGYETMFLLHAVAGRSLDIDAIRAGLEAMGESVLVAGDARAVKVHVHSERPDQVIAYGLEQGMLSRISVENLDAQARDVRERRAEEFTGPTRSATTAGPTAAARPTSPGRTAPDPSPANGRAPLAVIAVAAGDGLAAAFASFGCSRIVSGGQGANPSTGELLAAVRDTDAAEILLLPNNPNVLMAARQVADLATDRAIIVVPTRNAPEGLAALLALDPSEPALTNAEAMTRAARAIQTLLVTQAVRDAQVGGRKVKRGQTIVLDPDDGLVAADGDETKAVLAAVDALRPGFELVTMYYGDGADLATAEHLGSRVGEGRPGVEVEIVHGGQPHYRYLISAE
jgi:DAK2 domain fusion protein YloV